MSRTWGSVGGIIGSGRRRYGRCGVRRITCIPTSL